MTGQDIIGICVFGAWFTGMAVVLIITSRADRPPKKYEDRT